MAQSPASCLSMSKEDRQRNNLFYLLKNSIVGGPSIIFNRYHEANKTYQNGDKLCKTIIGYDANALNLRAIAQDMPTDKHDHTKSYNLIKLKKDRLNNSYLDLFN